MLARETVPAVPPFGAIVVARCALPVRVLMGALV